MVSIFVQRHYREARKNGEPHNLYVAINGLDSREAEELRRDYEQNQTHQQLTTNDKKQ